MGEGPGRVGAPEQEEEGHEPAGHVQPVEPGGYVEHRAVGAGREREALVPDQAQVLVALPEVEVQAHQEGEHVPLAQAPAHRVQQRPGAADLAALDREHAHLAGDAGQQQDGGVDRAQREVQVRTRPGHARALDHRPDGEVHREQGREEHQLRGQPDDGADADQVGSAGRRAGGRLHGCCRHEAIITTTCRRSLRDPPYRWPWFLSGSVPCSVMKGVVYSHDADVRAQVRLAIGRRPAMDVPEAEIIEVATQPALFRLLDAGGADVMDLDGEAQPYGGMGVCRQGKDEIYNCPPALLIVGWADDGWLATWSRAGAVVSHPIDPIALANELAGLLRERPAVSS